MIKPHVNFQVEIFKHDETNRETDGLSEFSKIQGHNSAQHHQTKTKKSNSNVSYKMETKYFAFFLFLKGLNSIMVKAVPPKFNSICNL